MLEKSLVPVAQWAGAACFFSPRDHLHSHSPLPGLIHPLFWISYCCFLRPVTPYLLIPITVIEAYILDQTTVLPSVPAITVPVLDYKVKMAADSSGLHQVLSQLSWLRLPLGAGQPLLPLCACLTALRCSWWIALLSAARQSLAAAKGRLPHPNSFACLQGNECQDRSHTHLHSLSWVLVVTATDSSTL